MRSIALRATLSLVAVLVLFGASTVSANDRDPVSNVLPDPASDLRGDPASGGKDPCDHGCRIHGCYVGVCEGFVATGPGTFLPFKNTVHLACDNQGNCSYTGFRSVNGSISVDADTITLDINPDCTGTATFGSGASHFFVGTNDGEEVSTISQTPGFTVTCFAKRQ